MRTISCAGLTLGVLLFEACGAQADGHDGGCSTSGAGGGGGASTCSNPTGRTCQSAFGQYYPTATICGVSHANPTLPSQFSAAPDGGLAVTGGYLTNEPVSQRACTFDFRAVIDEPVGATEPNDATLEYTYDPACDTLTAHAPCTCDGGAAVCTVVFSKL
jgi:hypothetical protein